MGPRSLGAFSSLVNGAIARSHNHELQPVLRADSAVPLHCLSLLPNSTIAFGLRIIFLQCVHEN